MATAPETVVCEACNLTFPKYSEGTHYTGKKHLMKQQGFERLLHSIFVSGVGSIPKNRLHHLFERFGKIVEITDYKNKPYCFIKFTDRESAQKALKKKRVFYSGGRLFVHPVKPQFHPNQNVSSKKLYHEPDPLDIEISEIIPLISLESDDNKSVFDLQVDQLISRIELQDNELAKHMKIVTDLEDTFKFLGARAQIFGSCGNSLALRNSDVDVYLECNKDGIEETFAIRECRILYKSIKLYTHIVRIPRARVPIVRFVHSQTGIRCDVTVKNKLGVTNSQLIKFLVSLDKRIRPFVMLLKYWAKECLISTNTQLCSYALILMAIFYLQKLDPPLLPPISVFVTSSEIQQGWHCGLNTDLSTVKLQENNMCLKDIVKGFFGFYATFDYEKYVICPLTGETIDKTNFEFPETLPDTMAAYKNFVRGNQDSQFKIKLPLRIQDPFELNYNLGRGFTYKHLKLLVSALWHAHRVFEDTEDESKLLATLIENTKKLLCPKQFEKEYRISWSVQGVNEMHVRRQPPAATTEALNEWFAVVQKAIMLVFTHVLKLRLEETIINTSKEPKKNSKQTVIHASKKVAFECVGNKMVVLNRKTLRRHLNRCQLNDFEKDVKVSESRRCLQDTFDKSLSVLVTLSLFVPSADDAPYALITIQDTNMKYKGNLFRPFTEFLQRTLEHFVDHAITHICLKRKHPSFLELTDLLPDSHCDCEGCKYVTEATTVKRNNKKGENEKVNMEIETGSCCVNTSNPFLTAIENSGSNSGSKNNESDKESQTLSDTNYDEWPKDEEWSNSAVWSKDEEWSNGAVWSKDVELSDDVERPTDETSNSRNPYNTNNRFGKSCIDNKSADAKTGGKCNGPVRSAHFVNLMDAFTLPIKNGASPSVPKANGAVKKRSNKHLSTSENTNRNQKQIKTSGNNSQTDKAAALGVVPMKIAERYSRISLEVKPCTKNKTTVTVDDMKSYVKGRFRCENIDNDFLLALTKITNDIRNNSSESGTV